MATEQDKTLKVLQLATQMEIDGKEYYLKVSWSSGNQLGKQLFQSLAAEEDIHRQKFEEIYNAISSRKTWPRTDFQPDGGKRLRTILAKATDEISSSVMAPATELDAIQTAINMESKTYDFYKRQEVKAAYDAERDFYHALVVQEREHQLILLDYYEYLRDPAVWFVAKEHPSLDGG